MRPRSPLLNADHSASGNVIVRGDLSLSSLVSADAADLLRRQFRVGAICALLHATFHTGISKVFGVSSKKQMLRIHARRIVAAMTDAQTFWNRSERKLPRYSVGEFISFGASLVSSPVEESPVAEARALRSPQPTRICFVNLAPKAFCGCYSFSSHTTFILSVVRGAVGADYTVAPRLF